MVVPYRMLQPHYPQHEAAPLSLTSHQNSKQAELSD